MSATPERISLEHQKQPQPDQQTPEKKSAKIIDFTKERLLSPRSIAQNLYERYKAADNTPDRLEILWDEKNLGTSDPEVWCLLIEKCLSEEERDYALLRFIPAPLKTNPAVYNKINELAPECLDFLATTSDSSEQPIIN